MTTKEMKLVAKENLNGRFGTTLLVNVVKDAACILANTIPFGVIVVRGALNVGVTNVYVKGNEKEDVSFEDMFSGFKQNFGENFIAGLLKSVFLFFWYLLFIIPGIVKGYAYAMTEYILVKETDISGLDAIKKSNELMNGHKMDLFLLDLSFLGWYLLVFATCGIAAIYVIPYVGATKTEFYKQIYESNNVEVIE